VESITATRPLRQECVGQRLDSGTSTLRAARAKNSPGVDVGATETNTHRNQFADAIAKEERGREDVVHRTVAGRPARSVS